MVQIVKTIPSLYKITAFATSVVSRNNFFSKMLQNNGTCCTFLTEKLYSSPHTAQPIWEGNYHIRGNYFDITDALNEAMDCEKTREIYGHMDYDISEEIDATTITKIQ